MVFHTSPTVATAVAAYAGLAFTIQVRAGAAKVAFPDNYAAKSGSKSTMVDASCLKMPASPSTFAVPSAI